MTRLGYLTFASAVITLTAGCGGLAEKGSGTNASGEAVLNLVVHLSGDLEGYAFPDGGFNVFGVGLNDQGKPLTYADGSSRSQVQISGGYRTSGIFERYHEAKSILKWSVPLGSASTRIEIDSVLGRDCEFSPSEFSLEELPKDLSEAYAEEEKKMEEEAKAKEAEEKAKAEAEANTDTAQATSLNLGEIPSFKLLADSFFTVSVKCTVNPKRVLTAKINEAVDNLLVKVNDVETTVNVSADQLTFALEAQDFIEVKKSPHVDKLRVYVQNLTPGGATIRDAGRAIWGQQWLGDSISESIHRVTLTHPEGKPCHFGDSDRVYERHGRIYGHPYNDEYFDLPVHIVYADASAALDVKCAWEPTLKLGGKVTNLLGTIELKTADGDLLSLETKEVADKDFTFKNLVSPHSKYEISISKQPAHQTCEITGGASAEPTADVTDVVVTCTDKTYAVSGTISGHSGDVVVSLGDEDVTVASSASTFEFTGLKALTSYEVTAAGPATQTCTVAASGKGDAIAANVTDADITCSTITYAIGGTVSGLGSGGTVTLKNNGGDDKTVGNGAFTFTTEVAKNGTYAVTATSPSAGYSCTLANESGTATADVTNVSVTCSQATYTLGGSVSGLGGGKSVVLIETESGRTKTVLADGAYTFTQSFDSGDDFDVDVQTQPAGQTCTVANDQGTLSANVANVNVTCADNGPSAKRIFITSTHDGDFGGISGADSFCMSDGNNPDAMATFKALLVDGTARVACTTANCGGGTGEHTDWVLDAGTQYKRASDNTVIGTTTANGVFTTLSAAFATGGGYYWTGLNTDWTSDTGNDCSEWGDGSGSSNGAAGQESQTNGDAVSASPAMPCDTVMTPPHALLCVEQ